MKKKLFITIFLIMIISLTSCASNKTIVIKKTSEETNNNFAAPIYFTCGENAALDNNNQEWSCGGNGETGQETYLFENTTLKGFAMDCNTYTGAANISIRKNLLDSGCYLYSDGSSNHAENTCSVDFNKGDWFQPFTITDSGHSQCVITIKFETR